MHIYNKNKIKKSKSTVFLFCVSCRSSSLHDRFFFVAAEAVLRFVLLFFGFAFACFWDL